MGIQRRRSGLGVSQRAAVCESRAHEGGIYSVAFSPDDRTIFSTGKEESIRVWDVLTGVERGDHLGHADKIWNLAVSPDGRTLASASADGTVKLWNTNSLRSHLQLPIELPFHFGFSLDGKTLIAFYGLPTWHLSRWEIGSGSLLERTPLKKINSYACSVLSRDERLLAVENEENLVVICNLVTGERQSFIKPDFGGVQLMEFSSDNRYLLVGQRLWEVSSLQQISLPWPNVRDTRFTSQREIVCILADDQTVGRLDLATRRSETVSLKPSRRIQFPTISLDGQLMATVNPIDGIISLWSTATFELRKQMAGHPLGSQYMAFSPDGRTLASCGKDNPIKLWDIATGEELLTLDDYRGSNWQLCFSPNGKSLAVIGTTGGGRGDIVLWLAADDDAGCRNRLWTRPQATPTEKAWNNDEPRTQTGSRYDALVWQC